MWKDLISIVTTLTFKMPNSHIKLQSIQRNRKVWPINRKEEEGEIDRNHP